MTKRRSSRLALLLFMALAGSFAAPGVAHAEGSDGGGPPRPCKMKDYPDVTLTPPFGISADLHTEAECFAVTVVDAG